MLFPVQVLVYLQLCKNVSLVFLDGWQAVTDHVCAVTKAISKRPFKYASTLQARSHDQTRKCKYSFRVQSEEYCDVSTSLMSPGTLPFLPDC